MLLPRSLVSRAPPSESEDSISLLVLVPIPPFYNFLSLCFKIAVVTRIGFGTVMAAAGFVQGYCCCEKGKRNLSRLRNSSSSGYLRFDVNAACYFELYCMCNY
ncbi:uncharacterized protein [Arachis hypogaea]|uniref:uncharacterized protein n=1 Tax=Arachis hypogaea TaxID=3818 RepID=UPI000DED1F7D|nr:uncharacterized protein LOC112796905 isoform X2 [Arachis hypogaea]